jgi:hypothetical protein
LAVLQVQCMLHKCQCLLRGAAGGITRAGPSRPRRRLRKWRHCGDGVFRFS